MMGIETEYALARRGSARSSGWKTHMLEQILRCAYSDLDCLRSDSGHGVFLSNGALLYADLGAHPELATAECSDPLEATRQVFAGDRLLHDLLGRVIDESAEAANARLYKSNVDNRGATWGSHESYAIVVSPGDFPVPLASFLATRMVFSGAGGLEQRGRTLRFALSPRASFIEKTISPSSTHARGIVHDKHEPLACAPFHRLHLTCGDSLRSHYAMWLRLATTGLVVAALAAGSRPSRHGLLVLPVRAMHVINNDELIRTRHTVASGARLSAIDIQRVYLEMVEAAGLGGLLPDWWPLACREWAAVLDTLARDPAELAGRLDWPLRLGLFNAHLAQRGLSWRQLRLRPSGRNATPLLPWGEELEDPDILNLVFGASAAKRARRARASSYEAPLADELREIDLRFGELGPESLHARLDAAGTIAHRLFDDEALERGTVEPPRRGRAKARGAAIRKLAGRRRSRLWASWDAVTDAERGEFLDLRHPLRDRVDWQPLGDEVPF